MNSIELTTNLTLLAVLSNVTRDIIAIFHALNDVINEFYVKKDIEFDFMVKDRNISHYNDD